jgi:hypothetical protein
MSKASAAVHRYLLPSDALLPCSVVLWLLALHWVHVGAEGLFGLPKVLPGVYYAALGVVLVSTGLLILGKKVSNWRLLLHLLVLIAILYTTAPILYEVPRYAWLYKHIGVTQYISAHGTLNPTIDIYQNWPGFFALAAWLDKVAGVSTPLVYAAWAQPFFELIYVLELAWILTALPMRRRERWMTLFVFVSVNWVAQDYFSPQGLAYVFALGILAMALRFLRPSEPFRWIAAIERFGQRVAGQRRARRPPGSTSLSISKISLDGRSSAHTDLAALVVMLVVTFALTFVHELSPYMVLVQMVALCAFGILRQRWMVVAMAAISVGYFVPRFAYVNKTYGLLASVGNFFGNVRPPHNTGYGQIGQAASDASHAANLLTLLVWLLAIVGAVKRMRQGRPTFGLLVLAFAPVLLLALLAYGGEGILRVYLFALPWLACLAASAIVPSKPLRATSALLPIASLAVLATLFVFAFFGDGGVIAMNRGDVQASEYLYSHTRPGPVMTIAGNFPNDIGATYNEYESLPSLLGSSFEGVEPLRPADITFVTSQMIAYGAKANEPVYLVASSADLRYCEEYGLATARQFTSFVSALGRARGWKVVYAKGGATILELPLSVIKSGR